VFGKISIALRRSCFQALLSFNASLILSRARLSRNRGNDSLRCSPDMLNLCLKRARTSFRSDSNTAARMQDSKALKSRCPEDEFDNRTNIRYSGKASWRTDEPNRKSAPILIIRRSFRRFVVAGREPLGSNSFWTSSVGQDTPNFPRIPSIRSGLTIGFGISETQSPWETVPDSD